MDGKNGKLYNKKKTFYMYMHSKFIVTSVTGFSCIEVITNPCVEF